MKAQHWERTVKEELLGMGMFGEYDKKWGWKSTQTQIMRSLVCLHSEDNSEPSQDFYPGTDLIREITVKQWGWIKGVWG